MLEFARPCVTEYGLRQAGTVLILATEGADKATYPTNEEEKLAKRDYENQYTDPELRKKIKEEINASQDDPRYLVESEKSGSEAAHKPDSLSKA